MCLEDSAAPRAVLSMYAIGLMTQLSRGAHDRKVSKVQCPPLNGLLAFLRGTGCMYYVELDIVYIIRSLLGARISSPMTLTFEPR